MDEGEAKSGASPVCPKFSILANSREQEIRAITYAVSTYGHENVARCTFERPAIYKYNRCPAFFSLLKALRNRFAMNARNLAFRSSFVFLLISHSSAQPVARQARAD